MSANEINQSPPTNKTSDSTTNYANPDETQKALGINEHSGKTAHLMGKVVDCARLNIREEPKEGSKILAIVSRESLMTVDESKSTEEWHCVCTESGVKGFCMSRFLLTWIEY